MIRSFSETRFDPLITPESHKTFPRSSSRGTARAGASANSAEQLENFPNARTTQKLDVVEYQRVLVIRYLYYPSLESAVHWFLFPSGAVELIAKRVWYRFRAGGRQVFPTTCSAPANSPPTSSPPVTKLPREFVEMVITHLIYYDMGSLRACSLTCRS